MLHWIDYSLLAAYLLAMVAIGVYFSREQRTSKDFFLAGRSMGWLPVGLSIMATLLSALSYTGVPGESYYEGLRFLMLPVAVWIACPLMVAVILPLYRRLEIYSVYEYLEMRFDLRTRMISSVIFVVWRLLWLGGVLFASCKVLLAAAQVDLPIVYPLLVLGLVATLYTFLGGMKAVIWTDVIQSVVMLAGVILIVGGVWYHMDGGPGRVWEIAGALERTTVIDTEFDWTRKWSIWGILPHFTLSMLSFYVADQITVQRYLTARSLDAARRSFLLNALSVSVMIPALAYVGICLLAFYHDHPQAMRAMWVVNVDNQTQSEITGDDRTPLIPWQKQSLDADALRELTAERRVLQPNNKEPFADAEAFLITEGGATRVDIEKLAMRRPSDSAERGEIILNRRAKDELMPRFITTQLASGMAGLIIAALLAASMSSMDSGLNSICTLMITDFHRRLGFGRARLARRCAKPENELDESDELRLGRPLVLVVGVAATLFSLLISRVNDIFEIMIGVVNTFGGPLMAVFLLGIFTRRCNPAGALSGLVLGTLVTIWVMLVNQYDSLAFLWPFPVRLDSIWPLPIGVVFTFVTGFLVSCVTKGTASRAQLRGLVLGLGKLGNR